MEKIYYNLNVEQVLLNLNTDPENGLSIEDVSRRTNEFGKNVLRTSDNKTLASIFLKQLKDPLMYVLLSASAASIFIGQITDAIVILTVVVLNALISLYQELKAVRAIKALSVLVKSKIRVIRSGTVTQIDAQELVPGDIIIVEAGDKIVCDGRVIKAKNFGVNESALTGESFPVNKSIEPISEDTALADRNNTVYAGTFAASGNAKIAVTHTGMNTEIGKISKLTDQSVPIETPLTSKLRKLSNRILVSVLSLSVLVFAFGIFIRNYNYYDMFTTAVALAVGVIPEGLPSAIIIILAIGVKRLANRKAIVRTLSSVETLGSATVICSDKTGTLTENRMTPQYIYSAGKEYFCDDSIKSKKDSNKALVETLLCGVYCNTANLRYEKEKAVYDGDPTEGALLLAANIAGIEKSKTEFLKKDEIPFDSEKRYMAVLMEKGKEKIIYLKGAADGLLNKCEHELSSDGSVLTFNELRKKEIMAKVDEYSSKGLRTLLFAMLKTDLTTITEENVSGLVFLGIQTMMDPPREEAIKAVDTVKKAGINIKMITGDHPLTANAIAKLLGITDGDLEYTITGVDLQKISPADFGKVVSFKRVFARISPEQKMDIVKALQGEGHVVAMTGDGVNDSPAIKQANIGLAMGITGTEAAKEAASIVLQDDNFATIEAAIEEGRAIYSNLLKFIVWALPANIAQGLVILTSLILDVPLPITPLQILYINMTSAGLLGLTLAFEPTETNIMLRKPRPSGEQILNTTNMFFIFTAGVLFLIFTFIGFKISYHGETALQSARTVALNTLVISQTFFLFSCRTLDKSLFKTGLFSNKPLFIGVILMLCMQVMMTYLPFMNNIFHTAPIQKSFWFYIVGCALLVYIIMGLIKKQK